MKKIPSLFMRNYDGDRLVRDEIVPGCEWVAKGEGIATRKFDGTCCMVREGILFKRYELKKGHKAPEGFEPAQDADPTTGDQPGWVPVGNGPEDQHHREGFLNAIGGKLTMEDGTYELVGPKVQRNFERLAAHTLVKHGRSHLPLSTPRTFEGLKHYLGGHIELEGVVWHHPDGRMVKIKRRDFFK